MKRSELTGTDALLKGRGAPGKTADTGLLA